MECLRHARHANARAQRLKKVVAISTVVFTALKAATLETCVPIHKGTDRCDRAFLRALSLRARLDFRVSHAFRMDTLFGACCCAQKHDSSDNVFFRMTASRLALP